MDNYDTHPRIYFRIRGLFDEDSPNLYVKIYPRGIQRFLPRSRNIAFSLGHGSRRKAFEYPVGPRKAQRHPWACSLAR